MANLKDLSREVKLQEFEGARYTDTERKMQQTLLSSLKFKHMDIAMDVVNYIIRIHNSDSFPAIIEPMQYEELLWKAMDGLVVLIYLEDRYFDYDMAEKDELSFSAQVLLVELSRRSFKGAEYALLMEREKAKQQINVMPGRM